jgi:hypothetical protein
LSLLTEWELSSLAVFVSRFEHMKNYEILLSKGEWTSLGTPPQSVKC